MEKVPAGPDHSTTVRETEISGVTLMTVPSAHYEYGFLSEIYNPEWESIYDEPLEHMYVIQNKQHERNQWHVHEHTVDRYVLLFGQLEVALFDARPESVSHGVLQVFALSQLGESGNHGLRIPPGVWHTFRSKDSSFTLLNNKSPKYSREYPDKFVIPFENDEVEFAWPED